MTVLSTVPLASMALRALLHAGVPLAPHDAFSAWTFDATIVLPLAIVLASYVRGAGRLRRRARRGQRVHAAQRRWFITGWMILALALVSPVHAVGDVLFSVHMMQHELLMVVAAPCLALSQPSAAFAWSLPRRVVHHATVRRAIQLAGRLWSWLAVPARALGLHVLAVLVWHLPGLYSLAVRHESMHALQHATFFGTALVFWSAAFHARGAARASVVPMLFLAMLATGLLGALLTFAGRPWYDAYLHSGAAWGVTALEDQQLGGVIMWLPGGLTYLVVALHLLRRWLTDSGLPAVAERRMI